MFIEVWFIKCLRKKGSKWCSNIWYIRTYLRTYLPTYVPTYLPTCALSSFLKRAIPGLFFVYFRFFKQTLQILQQINVKNVNPIYSARIQTHNLKIASLIPYKLDQGSLSCMELFCRERDEWCIAPCCTKLLCTNRIRYATHEWHHTRLTIVPIHMFISFY